RPGNEGGGWGCWPDSRHRCRLTHTVEGRLLGRVMDLGLRLVVSPLGCDDCVLALNLHRLLNRLERGNSFSRDLAAEHTQRQRRAFETVRVVEQRAAQRAEAEVDRAVRVKVEPVAESALGSHLAEP